MLTGMNAANKPLLAVIGAPAAALTAWALAVPLAGTTLSLRAGDGARTVGPVSVVVASLLAGLAAWVLLAILKRSVAHPGRTWAIIALAVLALSLTGPLGSAVGAAAVLVLMLMHLVVAAVLALGLMRR
jgi:Family of unknown function (DUF6069)